MVDVCAGLGWFEHTQLEHCDPITASPQLALLWVPTFGFYNSINGFGFEKTFLTKSSTII